MDIKTILPSVFAIAGNLLSVGAGSKLAAYSSAAQTAVKAAVTKVDTGVDDLQTAFGKFEASNPVVQEAFDGTVTLLRGLGVAVPKEDVVMTHVKAAIADLAGIFVPASASADATSSSTTTVAS
ncbi:hypothetical protein [Acetobacter persici]|uniref:Uncharacterized protein n=1 Tax=Acetobacter persici TaxID=1076596 RepID=A0A6V8IAB8_9PROT|nr:hypothetical protein [Acetobacter persici]OUI89017.1 hypothetical protein HK19_15550 [Acetobacter persici]GFE93516.1 hypothetical protein DmAi_15750 [Acetobacter persici]